MNDHAIASLGSSDLADLRSWLEEQHKQKAKRVVMRVRSDTGAESIVREIAIEPDSEATVDESAQSLMNRARSAARLQPGRTAFLLSAYSERADVIDSFGFVLTIEAAIKRDEAVHVELTSLLMRHTEASARLSLGHTLAIVQKYRELLDAREAQISALENRIAEMAETHERVMSIRFEREERSAERQASLEDRRYAKEKFDLLLPVVLSKVLPSAALPGTNVLADEMVDQVLSTLRPDQLERIRGILDMEQQVTFFALYSAYQTRAVERAKAKAAKEHADKVAAEGGANVAA
ncbi:MAG: hypothetical protein ACHREM_01620 [Polyangiales bacterium]